MGKPKLLAFRLPAVGLITNVASYDPKYVQKNKLQLEGDCLPQDCLMLGTKSSLPMSIFRLKHQLGKALSQTDIYCKNILYSQELNISLKPCFLQPWYLTRLTRSM